MYTIAETLNVLCRKIFLIKIFKELLFYFFWSCNADKARQEYYWVTFEYLNSMYFNSKCLVTSYVYGLGRKKSLMVSNLSIYLVLLPWVEVVAQKLLKFAHLLWVKVIKLERYLSRDHSSITSAILFNLINVSNNLLANLVAQFLWDMKLAIAIVRQHYVFCKSFIQYWLGNYVHIFNSIRQSIDLNFRNHTDRNSLEDS